MTEAERRPGDAATPTVTRLAGAVEVRPVRPEEHAAAGMATRAGFAALYGEGNHEDYLSEVADVAGRARRTTVLAAVAGDRILGTVTLELEAKVDPERALAPDEAHLRMLGVDPAAQGRGVGRALVAAAVEVARAAGKRRLTLGTMPEMAAARHIYESMGFSGGSRVEWAPERWCLSFELPLGG